MASPDPNDSTSYAPPRCPLCGGTGRAFYVESLPVEPWTGRQPPPAPPVSSLLLEGPCRRCRPEEARRWAEEAGLPLAD